MCAHAAEIFALMMMMTQINACHVCVYICFQINTVNLEALARNIDPSQLTVDLDGTLQYDHNQWIDVRLALEDFTWQATDLLDRLDDLQEDLSRNDFADDVGGAKHGIDMHNEMKKKIMKVPVEGKRSFEYISIR